ncbi:multicopy suppressor of BFA (Brefeldin A) [Yamadazyma tenuis]|uniref:multicopy suppressor of BFA (Brefeldin A) n=1 Tax=Candida tenuis TaxID=2315449 RepID=UPI0027A57D4A|nr:multicopy suppressor of BFA (Brefeldin A) [Yamadazyma tenuis]
MASFSENPQTAAAVSRRFIKRPDDSAMKSEVTKLRKEIEKVDLSINTLTSQIDKISVDSATNSKRQELQQQLKELTAQQASIKGERQQFMDQIKAIDTQLKRKVTEIQQQTSKNSFKSVKDIDARIAYLDSLVDGGELKLADERKTVKEMSALRKLKKDFGSVEKQQQSIDADKSKIADLKKKLNAIQNKEVQAKYEAIQKELDEIRSANKSIYDKKGDLVSKRNALRKEKDSKYDAIKKLRSEFDNEFTRFKTLMTEERKRRDEEYKSRQQEEKKAKAKEVADKELSEASKPAFETEINAIHSLLKYFDPEYVIPKPKTFEEESFVTNTNSVRTVEMPSDVTVLKKEKESFFEGTNSKKNKKGKSSKAKAFTVAPDIIVSLADLSIPLPTKQENVADTVATLKETLTALEAKQDEQTKANIEKAKAKVAKLQKEAEEAEAKEEDAEEVDAEEVDAEEVVAKTEAEDEN